MDIEKILCAAEQDKKGNFNITKSFFVIDSENLNCITSELFGFCISDETITDDIDVDLQFEPPCDGAYVYIERKNNTIKIIQDSAGCYGIYLYRYGNYFAISNSFIRLVEHVRDRYKITFNKDYALYFLTADLCSVAYSETIINEISLIPRNAIINIDVKSSKLTFEYIDYKENTVSIDTEEGIKILDEWYFKWRNIIRNLYDNEEDIVLELSGGFDSRITFLIAATAGIDLNKIWVKTINDNLYTHSEDYDIASSIADDFGFELNKYKNISNEADYFDVKDVINISLYLKSCLHKQMYFKYGRSRKRKYVITGFGGECIRSMTKWCPDKKKFIANQQLRSKYYGFKDDKSVRNSIEKVIHKTFTELECKYNQLNRPLITDYELASALYRETRNRNHFGKQLVENYFANCICISPLFDHVLQKLDISSLADQSKDDIIYAVIFDRYCNKLLNYKFQGNREINTDTLKFAKEINKKFPYKDCGINHKLTVGEKKQNITSSGKDFLIEVTETIKNSFRSDTIKSLFLTFCNEEVYDFIQKDMETRKYAPLSNAISVVGICHVLNSVIVNQINYNKLSDYIIYNAQMYKSKVNNLNIDNRLRYHEIIDNYITGRIDIKNIGVNNDIKIIEVSDNHANIVAPSWYAQNGKGMVIESTKGELELTFQCVGSGTLDISLRAKDLRFTGGRIPIFIDYNTLIINGNIIFDGVTPISHDKPFKYSLTVADRQFVTIMMNWKPHDIRNGFGI